MKLTKAQIEEMKQESPSSGLWFLCHCTQLHPWQGGVPSCPEFEKLIDDVKSTEQLDSSDYNIRINAR